MSASSAVSSRSRRPQAASVRPIRRSLWNRLIQSGLNCCMNQGCDRNGRVVGQLVTLALRFGNDLARFSEEEFELIVTELSAYFHAVCSSDSEPLPAPPRLVRQSANLDVPAPRLVGIEPNPGPKSKAKNMILVDSAQLAKAGIPAVPAVAGGMVGASLLKTLINAIRGSAIAKTPARKKNGKGKNTKNHLLGSRSTAMTSGQSSQVISAPVFRTVATRTFGVPNFKVPVSIGALLVNSTASGQHIQLQNLYTTNNQTADVGIYFTLPTSTGNYIGFGNGQLATLCTVFQKYRISNLTLTYVPSVGTSEPGTLVMALNPGAGLFASSAVDSYGKVSSIPNSISFPVSEICQMKVPNKQLWAGGPEWLFCDFITDSPAPVTDADAIYESYGVFHVSQYGIRASTLQTLGIIRVDCDIEFAQLHDQTID